MSERRVPFVMRILTKLSQEGLFIYEMESETGDFACLNFNNGIKHYVSRPNVRINFVGPHEIAKSK